MRIIDELKLKFDLELDSNGYSESILTENLDKCFMCGGRAENWHELQYGTADRKKSKALGLWIPLCVRCHRLAHHNKNVIDGYHELAQQECDKTYGDGTFVKVFKVNYL